MPGIGIIATKREMARIPRTKNIRFRNDLSPKISFNFSISFDILFNHRPWRDPARGGDLLLCKRALSSAPRAFTWKDFRDDLPRPRNFGTRLIISRISGRFL